MTDETVKTGPIRTNPGATVRGILFLLPLACILFVFRAVIFWPAIFSHTDVLFNYLPYYNALFSAPDIIQQGIISGYPILLSVSTTWFNPINTVLFRFFDAFDAFKLLDVAYMAGAYVFTYLYARRLRLGHSVAILVGLVYVFAGQIMLWSETIIFTTYYFILPAAMYLLDYAFARRGLTRWLMSGLAGAVLGLGWLSGHVQIAIYVHIFILAFWLFKSASDYGWRDKRRWVGQCGLFAVVMGVSFIVGYPMISSLLDFLSVTQRSGGVALSFMYAHAYMPYHLIHYLLPSFTLLSPIPYSPALHNYIGILPFLVLVFGLLHFKKVINRKPDAAFYLGVGLFCLAASFQYNPIIWLAHWLPLVKTFREAPRIMVVGDFALAVFIGYVLEKFYEEREYFSAALSGFLKFCRRVFIFIILPSVAVFSVIYIWFFGAVEKQMQKYFMAHQYAGTIGGYPPEHYFNIIRYRLDVMIGQFSITDGGVIIMIVFLFASYQLLRNVPRLTYGVFAALAVVITTANFGAFYADRIHTINRSDYLEPPATARLIMDREAGKKDSFRVFSPLSDTAIFNARSDCNFPEIGATNAWEISRPEFILDKELLTTNLNMVYGIETADGYEPYMPARVDDVMNYLGSRMADTGRYGIGLASENLSARDKVKKLIERKNILRLMNVKYVLSGLPVDDADFKEVFSEKLGDCGSPVYVYELTKPWPRYFLSDTAQTINADGDSADVFDKYMNTLGSAKKPVILLENTDTAVTGFGNIEPVLPLVDSDSVRISLSAPKPRYLFIGNAWLPRWRATIDGKPVDVLRANYIYMALYVPAGQHEIVLRYETLPVGLSGNQ